MLMFKEKREHLVQGKNIGLLSCKFCHFLIENNKCGAVFAIINSKLHTEPYIWEFTNSLVTDN